MPRTFAINTLGCKTNHYESEQIRELLEHEGLVRAEDGGKADIVVVNTCCVTHTASAKSRQLVRKAQKLHPGAAVVVCGCLPIAQSGELKLNSPNLHIVRGQVDLAAELAGLLRAEPARADSVPSTLNLAQTHREKGITALSMQNQLPLTTEIAQIDNGESKVPQLTKKLRKKFSSPRTGARTQKMGFNTSIRAEDGRLIKHKTNLANPPRLPTLTSFAGQTRAFLKIQDGCDRSCSYCVIPFARPKVHSKPPNEVLAEAEALVGAGHKEIVITGIHLGAYGLPTARRANWPNDKNEHLVSLLDDLAQVPGLARIRLSSLDPEDLTEELLDVLAEHRNILPHLHLSLQSGSDRILRRMCRQYTLSLIHI